MNEEILHVSRNASATKIVFTDNQKVNMQIDTEANVSIVSSNFWRQIGQLKLQKCIRRLEAYDGHIMLTLGKFTGTLDMDGRYSLCDFVAVKADKSFGLIGRDLLDMEQVDSTAKSHSHTILPTMKGMIAKMELIEGARRPWVLV